MSLNILYISTLSLEHVDLACVFIFVMLLSVTLVMRRFYFVVH